MKLTHYPIPHTSQEGSSTMKIRLIFFVACLMTLTISAGIGARVVHAYDRAVCDRMFGSANVEKVQSFNMNKNDVDFGDEPHFGGTPHGNAVICWSIDGRVAVKGKLYSDNFRDPQTATVEIRFRRTSGAVTGTTWRELLTQGGWVSNREVEKVSPVGSFKEVRIRLWKSLPSNGLVQNSSVIVGTRTFNR